MTTYQDTFLGSEYYLGSTSKFRTWGSHISTALDAIGLLKDPGHLTPIDWATVEIPPNANLDAGWEVRRLSDTDDTAHPIRVALAYGVGGNIMFPRLKIYSGYALDAGGGMTGWWPHGPATYQVGTDPSSHTGGMIRACRTDDGHFWLVTGTSGFAWSMGIERRRDQATGLPLATQDYMFWGTNIQSAPANWNNFTIYSASRSQGITRSAGIQSAAPLVWNVLGSGLSGGNFTVAPVYATYPEIELADMFALYRSQDAVTTGSTHQATILKNRTYIMLGAQAGNSGTNNTAIGLVWE